jgi:hypothetical protein
VIPAYVLGAMTPGQPPTATVGQLGFILGLEKLVEAGRSVLRPGVPRPRRRLVGGSGHANWRNRTILGRHFAHDTARHRFCRISPNMEKLGRAGADQGIACQHFPTLQDAHQRSVRCTSTHRCARRPGVTYESTVTTPPRPDCATAKPEAFLKAQPSLRNFHGVGPTSEWGNPVMERRANTIGSCQSSVSVCLRTATDD